MATIFERLKGIIMERLGVDEDQIVPAARFIRDLNADSIELIELVMSIEDEFSSSSHKIVIPDEELERLATIQDVVSYLGDLGVSDD